MANKWKNKLGRKKTRYLPLRFSNKIATNLPEGIDVDHLEDAKKKLRTLGFIHVPERLAPQTFHQDGVLISNSPLYALSKCTANIAPGILV